MRLVLPTVDDVPYPHFIVDDAMKVSNAALLHSVWPAHEEFLPERPGNFTYSVNGAPSVAVEWHGPLAEEVRNLTRTTLAAFAPWLRSRFGDGIRSVTPNILLMEAAPDFGGHPIHNHHWHSPNWIATTLVYLDSVSEGYDGTVVNAYRHATDIEASASAFARTHLWSGDPDYTVHRVIGYRENRQFAFLDGPMSYHSTLAAGPEARGGRRVLRIHIAAPWELCEAKYRVGEAEYQSLHPRGKPASDPRVVAWARNDIIELRQPVSTSSEQALAWADAINVEMPA